MKLIQTPSLITGAILGASLITLSAASNDSVLGGLNVFVPGTTVSSAEVNDNFTYVSNLVSYNTGNVASNSSRIDALENGSGYGNKFFLMDTVPNLNDWNSVIEVPAGSNAILLTSIRANASQFAAQYCAIEKADGTILQWAAPLDICSGIYNDNDGDIKLEGWRGEMLLNPGEKLLIKIWYAGSSQMNYVYSINGEYVN